MFHVAVPQRLRTFRPPVHDLKQESGTPTSNTDQVMMCFVPGGLDMQTSEHRLLESQPSRPI